MSPPGPRVIYQHQLEKTRARRKPSALRRPELTVDQILAWADNYHLRTGRWPKVASGRVSPTGWETWAGINKALDAGLRGLPGKTSLARVLAEFRGVRNPADLPDLSVDQILAWADAHHARAGDWPRAKSGPVAGAPGEKWAGVAFALTEGRRGLPGGRRSLGCWPNGGVPGTRRHYPLSAWR